MVYTPTMCQNIRFGRRLCPHSGGEILVVELVGERLQSEEKRQWERAINNGLCFQLGLMSPYLAGEKATAGKDRGLGDRNKQVVAQSRDCNFLHVCCLMEGKLRPERNLGMYCTTSYSS